MMMVQMKRLLSRRRFEALALVIGVVFGALHWWSDTTPVQGINGADPSVVVRAVQLLESRASDIHFRLRGPIPPHPDVVVAEVDERSAQKYGLWPWPREITAKAIGQLHRAGVAAVGLDMIFTDQAQDQVGSAYREMLHALDADLASAPPQLAENLSGYRNKLTLRGSQSPDDALAAAFAEAPEAVQGVIGYGAEDASPFSPEVQKEQERILTPQVITTLSGESGRSTFPDVDLSRLPSFVQVSAQTPVTQIANTAKWLGHFNVRPDPDGSVRRIPLLVRLERPKGLLPTFELRTAALYLGAEIQPVYNPDLGRLAGVRLQRSGGKPSIRVPIEPTEPMTLINHVGPGTVFKRISLADVVDGNFKPEELRGKAVLVGLTLVGEFDQIVTPFQDVAPGIYAHASMLSNILSGNFLNRPAEMRLVELLFILLSALALGRVLPRVNYTVKLVSIAVALGGWLVLTHQLFVHGIVAATVVPAGSVLVTSFSVIFLGYLSVDREKGQLRSAFQHYLNASVMEQMLERPEMLKLGGDKKEMTVLFSDIRGFTTLSERMVPEMLVKFINSYLTPMTQIVFDEGGTLDKYIGDALMAFWGAPLDQPDHPLRACRAAVRFLAKLEELKLAWRDQNLPEFDIGVGINTGPMIVGNMGSDIRFDYTVMGDSVNLASRLEGTNKEYHTRILMSEATWLPVKDQVIARRLGAVRVKGKRKPVRIYELRALGQPSATDGQAIQTFEAAVDAFAEAKFDDAEALFKKTQALWPNDVPCGRYLEDIAVLKARPPGPGWDGVFTATTK
jgi:adenylate cyclase